MYRQQSFREDRPEVLRDLIRRHPLASRVTAEGGIDANLLPFTLVVETGQPDRLRAHMPRSNDQIAALRAAGEVMLIFRGPEAYITPSWYETKKEHGRVVPTWNYAVVQAWGRPVVIDDPDWVMAQIAELTDQQEAGRAEPWAVGDAPEAFTAGLVSALLGIEIAIERIEGKWKVSQNQPEANRRGVVEGLRGGPLTTAMADLVAERGGPTG